LEVIYSKRLPGHVSAELADEILSNSALSASFKSIVYSMLCTSPKDRLSAIDVLKLLKAEIEFEGYTP